jgi:chemotaxis protein methyltransferase CheR
MTDLEVEELLKVINERYGYDFSGYSRASLSRRIARFMSLKDLQSARGLKKFLFNGEGYFELFLQEITVNVTEMFRDPSFYKALREKVVPQMMTYPHLKVWDAGCSSGEEVYSLAILLQEEKLYHKTRIYATDINQKMLLQAREGIYSLGLIKDYSKNYFQAGGKASLSEYYTAKYEGAKFNESLKQNMTFSAHNLATDNSFNEFNLIVCRNVLIYFQKELQEKVFELFCNSLVVFGYLALGNKETLSLSKFRDKFEVVDNKEKIYRKISD